MLQSPLSTNSSLQASPKNPASSTWRSRVSKKPKYKIGVDKALPAGEYTAIMLGRQCGKITLCHEFFLHVLKSGVKNKNGEMFTRKAIKKALRDFRSKVKLVLVPVSTTAKKS